MKVSSARSDPPFDCSCAKYMYLPFDYRGFALIFLNLYDDYFREESKSISKGKTLSESSSIELAREQGPYLFSGIQRSSRKRKLFDCSSLRYELPVVIAHIW